MRHTQLTNATIKVSQGVVAAQKRLLSLLQRIDQSVRIVASFGERNGELNRLLERRKGIVKALERLNRLVSKVIVSLNQRCPQCRHHSVNIRLQLGRVVSGKAVCEHCDFRVEVARLKNGIIAKCPECDGVATIAQGKRDDGSIFFAFACNRCNWVSDDQWTVAAFALLSH